MKPALVPGTLFQVCAPLLALAAAAFAPAQIAPPPAVVAPFVIAGEAPSAAPTASTAACPAGAVAVKKDISDAAAQQLASTVTFALQQQLTATGTATLLQPGAPEAPGTLVFAGCITRMEAGSKAKRIMIGMTSGATYLAAHIVVSHHTAAADVPFRDFFLEVKGQNVAPPVFGGVIYNAVHQSKTTLDADSTNLATKIVAEYRSSAASAAMASDGSPATNPAAAAQPKPASSTSW